MSKYELSPWQDDIKTVMKTVEAPANTVEADIKTVLACELSEEFQQALVACRASGNVGEDEDDEYTAISSAPPAALAPYPVAPAPLISTFADPSAMPTTNIRAQGSGFHDRSVVESAPQSESEGRVVELVSLKSQLKAGGAAPVPRRQAAPIRQLDIETREPGLGSAAPTDLVAKRDKKSLGDKLRALRSVLGTAKQEDKQAKSSGGRKNAAASGEVAARATVAMELANAQVGDQTMILSGSDLDQWTPEGEASKEISRPAAQGPSLTQMFALPPSASPNKADMLKTVSEPGARVARTVAAILAVIVLAAAGAAMVKPDVASRLYTDLTQPAPEPPRVVAVSQPAAEPQAPVKANASKARQYAAHASAAMAKGERDKALKIYREAHKIDPEDPVYDVIVRVLTRQEASSK